MENNNITRQDLLTGDDKQDLILDQAKKIANDGMGGLEGFVKKYNPDLLLGTYTTGEKVAKILGLVNMENYTREKDSKGNPNYKYARIIAKGAIKVEAKNFENWLRTESQKIYAPFQELRITLLENGRQIKKFDVNGIQVNVASGGTWFFTNEALVVAAFISEKPKADAIADSFLQYVKMQEIKAENADVFQETIENIKENLDAMGIDFSQVVDPDIYNDYLRADVSNSVLEFSSEYYEKIDETITNKINELEDKRTELKLSLTTIDKNSAKNRIKIRKIETEIDDITFNIEELLRLKTNIKDEIISFNKYVKDREGKAEYQIKDLLNCIKSDKTIKNNRYNSVGDIYTDLINLGVLYSAHNNYYPTDKYQWLYESCGSFQVANKKGKFTVLLNQFGFDVFYEMLSDIIMEKGITDDLIEFYGSVTPEELEAILYGKNSKAEFDSNK